jgi:hypothetical protein
MARNFIKVSKHQTGRTITTKTPYGSTSDMIVKDEDILKKVAVTDNCVLLKDDEGYYITTKNRIDDGLSDPVRYCDAYRDIIANKILQDIEHYDAAHKEIINE